MSDEKRILAEPPFAMATGVGELCTINYCFDLPPVHPKCRWFDHRKIMALGARLAAANDMAAVNLLAEAMKKILSQPRQGGWHQFKPGFVGHTHIIALHCLIGLEKAQITKIGICPCPDCQKPRRAN